MEKAGHVAIRRGGIGRRQSLDYDSAWPNRSVPVCRLCFSSSTNRRIQSTAINWAATWSLTHGP